MWEGKKFILDIRKKLFLTKKNQAWLVVVTVTQQERKKKIAEKRNISMQNNSHQNQSKSVTIPFKL